MKREILFRGKDEQGDWHYGSLTILDDDTNNPFRRSPVLKKYHIWEYNSCDWNLGGWSNIFVNKDTIGQFTGLTDKNGTKIFEGDIVKTEIERMKFTTTVVWGEKSKGWSLKCDRREREKWGKIKYYSLPFSHKIEVIGNIFDNKELIK